MRTNYILVDYQNIQKFDSSKLKENDNVIVFLGAKPASVKADLVLLVQKLRERGCFYQVEGVGTNAADLNMAFRAGQLSVIYPGSSFQVISKDGDFIPLVDYLNKQGIKASNGTTLGAKGPAKSPPGQTKLTREQIIAKFKARVVKPSGSKLDTPHKLRCCLGQIQKDLSIDEFEAIAQVLMSNELVLFDEGALSAFVDRKS